MRARPYLSFQFGIEPKVAFRTYRKMPVVVIGGLLAPLSPVRAMAPHPPVASIAASNRARRPIIVPPKA